MSTLKHLILTALKIATATLWLAMGTLLACTATNGIEMLSGVAIIALAAIWLGLVLGLED